MNFSWIDYNPETMGFIEKWLDEETVNATGLDDGWQDFYEYWLNDENTVYGENYWCKAIFESGIPIAVIAVGLNEGKINIMEIVVKPEERGKGKGTSILNELLKNGEFIIGGAIVCAEAVIYPSNTASEKAFKKAGFVIDYIHEDGDAINYKYVLQ